jgi:hypothetical protein
MILLYTLLVCLLTAARFLLGRRTAALEKRHARAATEADRFLRRAVLVREGNSNRPDPYEAAKRQYLLGALVQKRDRLEDRYHGWQQRGEKLDRAVTAVRGWKGKKLPYTFGVLDISAVLTLVDYFGVGDYVSVRQVVELVKAFVGR